MCLCFCIVDSNHGAIALWTQGWNVAQSFRFLSLCFTLLPLFFFFLSFFFLDLSYLKKTSLHCDTIPLFAFFVFSIFSKPGICLFSRFFFLIILRHYRPLTGWLDLITKKERMDARGIVIHRIVSRLPMDFRSGMKLCCAGLDCQECFEKQCMAYGL